MQLEEGAVPMKMSKQKKTSNSEEIIDRTAVETVDVENNSIFGKERKKKKKKKKENYEVGGNFEIDSESVETVNGEGIANMDVNMDADKQQEKVLKQKNKKSKLGEEVTGGSDTALPAKGSSSSLAKEDINKMKNKKKHEVGEGDDQTDKDPKVKKMKKKNLEPSEDQDTLNASELKHRKQKEKRNDEKKVENGGNDILSTKVHEGKKTGNKEGGEGQISLDKGDITDVENTGEGGGKKKKKKKKRKRESEDNKEEEKKTKDKKEIENPAKESDENGMEKVKRRKKKTENIKDKDGHNGHLDIYETQNSECINEKIISVEKTKSIGDGTENSKPKGKKAKKVRFSGDIEVFPLADFEHTSDGEEESQNDGMIRGKRFTREEDEIVKQAVLNYIETHGLGEDGLKMVMQCSKHSEIRNCWKDIAEFVPNRPQVAVYNRAHILFERDVKHDWTKEEIDLLQELHGKHGKNWKLLGELLGKHRIHVKDAWRRIKQVNQKKGPWSQDEYQNLFDLVNLDLRMRIDANEEKKSKYGMLRDNICWEAISDKLTTRNNATCCMKWYKQLTSSMVEAKIWAHSDDYLMLDALLNLDATCKEDVDWDNLLEHRPGDLCRKRWDQMALHIGAHGNKSFAEQVEILSKRYRPDLKDAQKEWEEKPLSDKTKAR